MTMRSWPKKGTVPYEDLVGPLRRVLRVGYRFSRMRSSLCPLSYDGYDIGDREKATELSPDARLSPEGLAHLEEQGQDLLDVVLSIVFQLGMEQGRRRDRLVSVAVEEKLLLDRIEALERREEDLAKRIEGLERARRSGA